MPKHIVISDASTIIGLLNIDAVELLRNLYQTIEITSIVSDEVGVPLPDWMEVKDDYNPATYEHLRAALDDGEASAIALALQREDVLLIIDERKGRRKAKEMGLRITGVTGVVIRAKKEGHVKSGRILLDALLAKGFRLSESIYRLALEQMEEE